jgi:hypothetical protein
VNHATGSGYRSVARLSRRTAASCGRLRTTGPAPPFSSPCPRGGSVRYERSRPHRLRRG